MVLWKKESNHVDAFFVDLFGDATRIPGSGEWDRKLQTSEFKNKYFYTEYNPGKNNSTSDILRVKGNLLFKLTQYSAATDFYSLSLCFAEIGTDNVSFAYANRAACFLILERYDECLRDIESAKQADYPHKAKLMERKEKCQRLMQKATKEDKFDLKLSLDPSVEFPCMVNALEVRRNEEFGRHVIANTDIGVGKTVLIEKSFISLGCAPNRVQCYNCTKEKANFIPCDGCTDVMFCSEECRSQNIIHQKFCGETINRMPHNVRYVAESLLLGIIGFSSANEMMNFVEETLAQRSTHVPSAINDLRSKYGQFLSRKARKPYDSIIQAYQIYQIFTALLEIPSIKSMFNTEKSQRFLVHLVAEHWSIVNNWSASCEVDGNISYERMGSVTQLFNHSCAPNLCEYLIDDSEVFITIRPIKKGDQLFISYVDCSLRTNIRQVMLLYGFNFHCKCDKCEPPMRCESNRSKIVLDPSFQFLKSLPEHPEMLPIVKDKCAEFLGKFGHLPWSEEMDLVSNIYSEYLLYSIQK